MPATRPAPRTQLVLHALLALCAAALGSVLFAPAVSFHAVYDDSFVLSSRDLHTPLSEWLADGCAYVRGAVPAAHAMGL